MNYQINKIVVGELKTNCYIISNEKQEALIIDPGDEAKKIMDHVKNYKITGILVTHHHYDHIGALKELEEYYHVKENEKNSFDYETIETKGHTNDSLTFYFPSICVVFTGDFIFSGTIGRTDFGGNKEDMQKSIEKFLNKFPSDITIYPGHGKETTLEKERENLKWIQKNL